VHAPIEKVLTRISTPVTDVRCDEVRLADVRARLVEAMKFESIVSPRETPTWPQNRALVEWLIRGLPDGGSPLPRPELSDTDVFALARRFVASPGGAIFGRRHWSLCVSLIEFGTDCSPGDPMRWNERRSEQWLFEHLLGEPYEFVGGMEAAPLLLRAYIRFAHDEVGIRSDLTDEVVAAIDARESEYRQKVRRKFDDEGDWLEASGER
jgi:hypothetical protein